MKAARLIVADSERDADMLYATGFFVPDPFVYFEIAGKRHIVVSDLEIDRAKKRANVDRVLPLRRFKARGLENVLPAVLREFGIRAVEVPGSFPIGLARKLRGVRVKVRRGAFFPERERKTPSEVRKIRRALWLTQQGMAAGISAIRRSRIGRDGYLYRQGKRLTSEDVKGVINATISRAGGVAQFTIVAGGNQACDPHETGHGSLRAHWPIIVDIFPRDTKTGYWGDITRTVVRGRASDRVKKMYATVCRAQGLAFERLRDGVDGKEVHDAILALFRREGFHTGRRNGRMQGFFHGTGHGIGLEIHERPRVAGVSEKLKAGHVVTVEPGLYYWGVGGVRLEDVVVIGQRGARVLTRFPKFLEL
jgi:Xaa-Pro aminopeptidase